MHPQHPEHPLVPRYRQLLARLHTLLHTVEAHTVQPLQRALEQAQQQAVHLGELTREEAEHLGQVLRRDLHSAAQQLQADPEELRRWWAFDLEQTEQRLWEQLSQVADRTEVELYAWAETAQHAIPYQTGALAAPGPLVCQHCGHAFDLARTGPVPPCPACLHTTFSRPTFPDIEATNDNDS